MKRIYTKCYSFEEANALGHFIMGKGYEGVQNDSHRYCELLRFRADKDPNRKDYISMCKPTDITNCTLFWREKGDNNGKD